MKILSFPGVLIPLAVLMAFASTSMAAPPSNITNTVGVCDPNSPQNCQAPFRQTGSTVSISATTTSSVTAIAGGSTAIVTNNGTTTAYVSFGSTPVASAASIWIPAGAQVALSTGNSPDVAVAMASGTGTVVVTPGVGGFGGLGAGGGGSGGGGGGTSFTSFATQSVTPITAGTTSAATLIPATGSPTVLDVYNSSSTATIYFTLGTTSGVTTSTTTGTPVAPGTHYPQALGANTYIATIASAASTPMYVVAGTGELASGWGGGGGSSSGGGAITAASGAYASGSISTGAFAAGSIGSGAFLAGSISAGAAVSGAFVTGAIVDLGASAPNGTANYNLAQIVANFGTPIPVQSLHDQLIGAIEGTGTAGIASAYVVTVQGIAGGTAIPVSLSGNVNVTNSGTFQVQATLGASTTGGTSSFVEIVPANITAVAIKTSAGTLYGLYLGSNSATPLTAPLYIKLYNAAQGSVTCGTTTPPTDEFILTGGSNVNLGPMGEAFSTAITACITGGISFTDSATPAANTYTFDAQFK